jgi:hypothetical protein
MPILTMTEAGAHYKVDKKLIRRTISEFPDFPYTPAPPGRAYEGHKFNTDAVDSWLLINHWARGDAAYHPEIEPRLAREAAEKIQKQIEAGILPTEYVPPSVQKMRDKEQSKNKKSDVQTALLQLELDKRRGKLIDRDEVIAEFAPKISRLAKGLELFANKFGKKFNLTDPQIREVRDYVDELRLDLTRDDGGILSDEYEARSE